MKKTMLSIVIMLSCVWGYAQELPTIIPPSPTSYELGKYGDVNVGYFNGTIQPSIPAFEYKTSNLKVPISLSYSSNGIKVDQLATNVGLGWNLNIGGVISRVVRGTPDEDRNTQIPQSIIGNYNSDEAIQYFESYSIGNSDVDTSVDIFNYNFLGKSGKFVLDENKNIVQLEPNGLKIEMINGFTITDELGVKYYFSAYESTMNRSYGAGHNLWTLEAKTAWYLTKISHPKGDEIYFSYASDSSHTYDSGKSQSLKGLSTLFQESCPEQGVSSGFSPTQVSTYMTRIVGAKKITEITNNLTSDKIVVNYKSNPEVNIDNLIQKISLYNEEGLEIESLNLSYLTTPVNRVFLNDVTFKDINKRYSFKYISPELLPERLSFSQDHWGYYNGKNNSYFFPNPSKIDIIGGILGNQNIGADKEISTIHSQYGILEEITYPTKGKTMFEYENNSYWGTEEIMPEKEQKSLVVGTNPSEFSKTDFLTITDVKISQEVDLNKNISYNSYDCDPNNEIPHHTQATITIENLTESQSAIIFHRTTTGNYSLGNSINISPSNTYPNTYLNLKENCDYKITLSVTKPCLSSNLNFSYHKGASTIINKNILLGGLRIKKQENVSTTGQTEIKAFFYGSKETPEVSSGKKGNTPWYISNVTTRTLCDGSSETGSCQYVDNYYQYLNSSSLNNLYNSSSFNTDYRNVTISYGGVNFENGGEEHEYIINPDSPGYIVRGNHIHETPLNNSGWSNGLLKRQTLFKKNNSTILKINEKENLYTKDSRLYKVVYGLNIKKQFNIICQFASPNISNLENLDVMETRNYENWHYLSRTTEKQYDNNGLNPITTTTNYFYDNPNHLQQTRKEVINSKGEVIKTETKYAHDVNDTRLIDEHRIGEPLEVITYKDAYLLNHQRTIYDSSHNTSNLYLPSKIQTLKGVPSTTNVLEDRVVYHTYDAKGNPLEVSKKDGTHIVYIWGYNQTQPIAKIENATLSDISTTTISDIQTKSNADNDRTIGDVGYEGALRTALNTLRTSLPNAQVTTFTYDPLVGVTSITDPRGQIIYYEYDDFNRLEFIKDADGNLLKEHKYHYKN